MAVYISYSGISQPTSGMVTNTLGPLPSVAVVSFLPQVVTPDLEADLTFGDGIQAMVWTDARLDMHSLSISVNGNITAARIFDRRFWWKFTTVSGVYNRRRADGSIENEKTPQELAEILLDAMGETGYTISALPNRDYDRPFVFWDCTNPAYELHRLCKDRACEISLKHSNNTVVLVELGSGASIPSDSAQSISYGYDYGEYPETVRVCASGTEFNAKLKLRAIGVDTDGSVKLINELSFMPDGGWSNEDPGNLIPDAEENERELANKYVFKLYRIESFSDDSLDVPGGPTITSMDQITLSKYLSTVSEDEDSGRFFNDYGYIEGVFFPTGNIQATENTEVGVRYSGSFRVDPETGYVAFQDSVFKLGDGEIEEADLYLLTGFSVKDLSTGRISRYTRDRSLSGGTGIYALKRPELKRIVHANYDSEDPTILDAGSPYTDNDSDLEDSADDIIDSILPRFVTNSALQVKYIGIKSIQVDGVNRQVKHTINIKRGANTWVSQNTESEIGVLRSHEVERIASLRQMKQEGAVSEGMIQSHSQRIKRI